MQKWEQIQGYIHTPFALQNVYIVTLLHMKGADTETMEKVC